MVTNDDGEKGQTPTSLSSSEDSTNGHDQANNDEVNDKGNGKHKLFELFHFGPSRTLPSSSSNDDGSGADGHGDEDDEDTQKQQQQKKSLQEMIFGRSGSDVTDDDGSGDDDSEEEGKDIQDIAASLRDAQVVVPDKESMLKNENDAIAGGGDGDGDGHKSQKDDFWGNLMKMIQGGDGSGSGDDDSLSSAVAFARSAFGADRGEMAETKSSISPDAWLKLSRVLLQQLEAAFGDIPVDKIDPVALPYYLEGQDAKKNPSWKRRLHRFMKGVPKETIFGLHDALYLSELAYVDTVEEVQAGLEKFHGTKFELVYCTTESTPVAPAHFMVLKKEPKRKSKGKKFPWWPGSNKVEEKNYIEIVLSIRGTKTVEDILSDALLECTDYRGGKAHDGVCASGISIVKKHTDLILHILEMSGREKVRLTLLGHSLGAGAASIACIEFNESHPDKIDADCIGFGCPALLSAELSQKWETKITTVINDADLVVRMSGATVGNFLMDLLEFDYKDTLMEDVKQLADLVSEKMPLLLPEDKKSGFIDWFEKKAERSISPIMGLQRKEVQLWPPGRCIHFYRDGVGVSVVQTPCTLFNEFDVSRTMLDDHLVPTGYEPILLESIRTHLKNPHFQFKNDVLSLRGENLDMVEDKEPAKCG